MFRLSNDNSYFKVFFKKNLAYTIAFLFERSIVFLLLPFYTSILLPEDYGVYSILMANIGIITFLYTFGVENGLLKFINDYEDTTDLYSTTFFGIVSPSILITILVLLLSSHISVILFNTTKFTYLINLTAIILFFDNINRFYLYDFVGKQKSKIFTLLNISKGIIIIILNIYFVGYLKKGIEGIFLAYLISSILAVIIYSIVSNLKIKLKFNIDIYKKILKFGFPMMINSLIFLLLNFLDTYFLQFMWGAETVGKYSAIYKLGLGMNVIATSYIAAAMPFAMKLLKTEKDASLILDKINTIVFIILTCIAILISLFSKEITQLSLFGYQLIATQYLEALDVVPIILTGYLLVILFNSFSLSIYYVEKTYLVTLASIFALVVNVILNFILIPKYSYWGAAIATLISFMSLVIITYIYSYRLKIIQYSFYYIWQYIIMLIVVIGVFYLFELSQLQKMFIVSILLLYSYFIIKKNKLKKLKII